MIITFDEEEVRHMLYGALEDRGIEVGMIEEAVLVNPKTSIHMKIEGCQVKITA